MKKLILGAVIAAVVPLFAAIVDIDTAEELATKFPADTTGSTINYKGASATFSGPLVLSGTNNKSSTINVENADTTLTLTGAVTPSAPRPFVKLGPGTLLWSVSSGAPSFTGGWNQYGGGMKLAWDADGNLLSTAGGNEFTIGDGTFVYNVPGKTLNGQNVSLGSSESTVAPRLEVLGGTFQAGNILNLGYGADYTKFEGPDVCYVGPNGKLSFASIWMGRKLGGTPNHLIDVNGGILESYQKGIGSNNDLLTISVHDGATFHHTFESSGVNRSIGNYNGAADSHFTLGSNTKVNVLTNSLLQMTSFANSGVLTVEDSRFEMDQVPPSILINNTQQSGTVNLNGVTLAPFTTNMVATLIGNVAKLNIGEKGVTVETANAATLDAKATGTGTITKKGAGYLSMQATDLPVKVDEGTAAFAIPGTGGSGTITPAAGTKVVAAGANALGDMTLKAGAETNVLEPGRQSMATLKSTFNFTASCVPHADGWIALNHPRVVNAYWNGAKTVDGGVPGGIWFKEKVDLARKLIVDFDYAVYITHPKATGAYKPYGFSCIWQNYANTLVTTNGHDRNSGFDPAWGKACHGVCFDAPNSSMHELREVSGKLTYDWDDYAKQGLHGVDGQGTIANPARGHIEYDPTTHEIAFTMSRNGQSWTFYSTNNLASTTATPDNSCYFGIIGGGPQYSATARGGHLVKNVTLRYADDPAPAAETVAVGGKLDVAANETMNISLSTDEAHKDYKVDALNYAAGATVNVGGAAEASLTPTAISGSGKLVKTGAAKLGLSSPLYPIAALDVQQGGLTLGDDTEFNDVLTFDTDHWQINEIAENRKSGAITANSIAIGRYLNAATGTDHYTGMINSKMRIRVDQPFSLSYDLKIDKNNVQHINGFFSVLFHNDPRGAATVGKAATAEANLNSLANVKNCAAIVYGGQNSGGHANQVMYAEGDNIGMGSGTWYSTSPVKFGWTDGVNNTSETNGAVTVTYDPATKNLHLHMMHYGKTSNTETNALGEAQRIVSFYDRDFANVDLEEAVGDKYAHLAFAVNTDGQWHALRQTITNLRYTKVEGPLAPAAENWTCKNNGDATHENPVSQVNKDGISVGRNVNGKGQISANVTCNTRVKVNTHWKLEYDLELGHQNTAGNYGRVGVYFHNDPNGANAPATYNTAQVDNWATFLMGVQKFAAVIWTGNYADANHANCLAIAKNLYNDADLTYKSISPLVNGAPGIVVNHRGATKMHVVLTYDPSAKNIHAVLTQSTDHSGMAGTFQTKEVDLPVDLYAEVGNDDYAYIGFGATSGASYGYHAYQQRVVNLTYTDLDIQTVVGPYADELTIDDNAAISRAEGIASAPVKLADTLTVANGASLGFTGMMTAGSVACDGMFTVDGGVFAVADENTLKDVKKINLANGAKLNIPAGVTITLKGIYKDGVRLANGTYTDDIVEGGGSVEVAAPGLMILLK